MNINYDLKKWSKNFVINTNRIRKFNSLSMQGMADVTGLSENTIRRIATARYTRFGRGEQGYIPSLKTVVKVAEASGVSIDTLLTTE